MKWAGGGAGGSGSFSDGHHITHMWKTEATVVVVFFLTVVSVMNMTVQVIVTV